MIKYITAETMWIPLPIKLKGMTTYIHLDKGYCWDGCSGLLVYDLCRVASALHDWLYIHLGKIFVKFSDGTTDYVTLSRKQCDQIYRKVLSYSSNYFRRWERYFALRSIGGKYWVEKQAIIVNTDNLTDKRTCPHNYPKCCYHPNSQMDVTWWEPFKYYKV